jgi:hypothetical protein
MSESEQVPEFDPEEHLEAGLSGLSSEEIVALNEQAVAEYGEPSEVEVEDEPLDEADLLAEAEEDGS